MVGLAAGTRIWIVAGVTFARVALLVTGQVRTLSMFSCSTALLSQIVSLLSGASNLPNLAGADATR